MNRFSCATRSVTFAAIVGLSLGVGAAPSVVAQETAVNQTAGNSPLVNKDAKGQLTIHKKANPTNLGTPTGKEDATVTGEDLDGVGFTVYKINDVDVTTNAGLLAASKVEAKDYLKGGTADTSKVTIVGQEQFTSGGKITLPTLALGAYLVVETTPKEGYDPAAPFVAFVPMTEDNAAAGGIKWNYDVHAYPKNYKRDVPTKTVKDKDQNVGDKELVYSISADARQLPPGEAYTQFMVEDSIDAKLEITDVKVTGEGTKSELNDSDFKQPLFSGQKVTVDLNEQGLAKLQPGAKITVTVTTTVKQGLEGVTDVAPNTAKVYQNKPGGVQDTTGTPTPTVKTYWGGLKFKKVDNKREGLKGAEFQIVRLSAQEQCSSIKTSDKNAFSNLVVNGQQNGEVKQTFTSSEDGTVQVTGLHVNDFENNEEIEEASQSKYCLVETKAPVGKELLAEAIEFKLVAQKPAGEERKYELASVKVGDVDGEVVNIDDTTPQLPLTGGAGIGILAALGALIIGAGAWLARRNSAKS